MPPPCRSNQAVSSVNLIRGNLLPKILNFGNDGSSFAILYRLAREIPSCRAAVEIETASTPDNDVGESSCCAPLKVEGFTCCLERRCSSAGGDSHSGAGNSCAIVVAYRCLMRLKVAPPPMHRYRKTTQKSGD